MPTNNSEERLAGVHITAIRAGRLQFKQCEVSTRHEDMPTVHVRRMPRVIGRYYTNVIKLWLFIATIELDI